MLSCWCVHGNVFCLLFVNILQGLRKQGNRGLIHKLLTGLFFFRTGIQAPFFGLIMWFPRSQFGMMETSIIQTEALDSITLQFSYLQTSGTQQSLSACNKFLYRQTANVSPMDPGTIPSRIFQCTQILWWLPPMLWSLNFIKQLKIFSNKNVRALHLTSPKHHNKNLLSWYFWVLGIYTDIFFVLIETSPLLIQNGNSNLENIWIWKDTKGQYMSWYILMIYLQNYSLHCTKRSRKCKSTCFLRNCEWNLRRFWTTHKCQRHRPFGSKVLLACVQNNWRKAPNSFIRK